MNDISQLLLQHIRDIPDFPKKGIVFKDITTLLNHKEAFAQTINHLYERYKDKNIDYIVGIEARGFIFGAALANRLKVGFVPIRKAGKLPSETYKKSYDLEYGQDSVEIHQDAFRDKLYPQVVLIDDVLATGGTAKAALDLLQLMNVECFEACFVMKLNALKGDKLIKPLPLYSILEID